MNELLPIIRRARRPLIVAAVERRDETNRTKATDEPKAAREAAAPAAKGKTETHEKPAAH